MACTGDAAVDIARLNARVETIITKAIKEAGRQESAAGPEIVAAMKPGNPVKAGSPVYRERSEAVVHGYLVFAGLLIVWSAYNQGVPLTLLYALISFVVYDFYSGLLHVVLDEPQNIAIPLLGQPCLEFQMHHHIPNDIALKSLAQACGDLNVVVGLLALIHFLWSSDFGRDSVLAGLGGCKLLAAYYGQFSHRSAHYGKSRKSTAVRLLQDHGLMISVKDHKLHHTPPHDLDFCLIGFCNPIFDYLVHNVMTNKALARWVWLIVFLVFSIVDLPVLAWGMRALNMGI